MVSDGAMDLCMHIVWFHMVPWTYVCTFYGFRWCHGPMYAHFMVSDGAMDLCMCVLWLEMVSWIYMYVRFMA